MDQPPQLLFCRDNGKFPNSPLPVILYRDVLRLPALFRGFHVRGIFASHQWTNAWDAGVFTYDHYHSTTHEVLGFYKGSTTLQLGGQGGQEIDVNKGDILIIPAGVAHKNLGLEYAVRCIGAYPDGRSYDIRLGEPGERPATDKNIAAVPMPEQDPFYGPGSGLPNLWTLGNVSLSKALTAIGH